MTLVHEDDWADGLTDTLGCVRKCARVYNNMSVYVCVIISVSLCVCVGEGEVVEANKGGNASSSLQLLMSNRC